MPILNYTTSIAAGKTMGEIQDILAKRGARSIMVDYEDAMPSAISFALPTAHGLQSFRLPANITGVHRSLVKQLGPHNKLASVQQANRVGWRIIKAWIEAQAAIIEAGMVTVDEVFHPYLLNAAGVTVYEAYQAEEQRLLPEHTG